MAEVPFADNSLVELLFESHHTLVAYMDVESNFLRVSEAYALASGHDRDFFTGKNHFELYPSDENLRIFNNVVKTGEPYFAKATSFRNINMLNEGDTETFWDCSLSPVKDEQGIVTSVLLQLVDVTRTVVVENKLYEKIKKELHHYDKELEGIIESRTKLLQETVTLMQHENDERVKTQKLLITAKEDAENANLSKSQFLSRMSHELRTPLNAILGFSQLIQLKEESEIISSHNDEILLAGNHLLSMISDILDLSRVEEGSLTLAVSNIPLTQIINESISLVQHKLGFRNVVIHNLIDEDDATLVSVDKTRLKEVVVNILTNAIKYNVDNGLVAIGYRTVGKDEVRIYISDTGKGLSEGEQVKIFEPFNRLGAEYTDIEGVGIGLTISRKLMEIMGGSISIESERGKGTTFYLDCPIGKTTEINTYKDTTIDLVNEGFQYNIMYVEDNKSNQMLVKNLFIEYPNINLTISSSAEDGLSTIESEHFDLIILDINLPGMDGYGALEKLKRDATTKDIPVVALSASASADDIKKGLKAGFNKYITKPVVISELISLVNEELNGLSKH